MKTRKLTLNRETLTRLDDQDLGRVQGGTLYVQITGGCNYTLFCSGNATITQLCTVACGGLYTF